jgi:hypothetical protein
MATKYCTVTAGRIRIHGRSLQVQCHGGRLTQPHWQPEAALAQSGSTATATGSVQLECTLRIPHPLPSLAQSAQRACSEPGPEASASGSDCLALKRAVLARVAGLWTPIMPPDSTGTGTVAASSW